MKGKRIGIYITVKDNEMLISSKIYLLKHYLKKKNIGGFSITVVDNGSTDRSGDISSRSGARLLQYSRSQPISSLIEQLKKRIEPGDEDIIVLVDGNSSVEPIYVSEMIESFLNAEKRSGLGFISEQKNGLVVDINALIFLKEVFLDMPFAQIKIGSEDDLLHFGKGLGMEIYKRQVVASDLKNNQPLIRIPLKSWRDLIKQYKKTYPLRYYGAIGGSFLILSMVPGVFLLHYFIKYTIIDYPSFFVTVILVGIAMVFFSFGLILNSFNVLSEKVKDMM